MTDFAGMVVFTPKTFNQKANLIAFVSAILFLFISIEAVKAHFYLMWLVPGGLILILLAISRIDLFFLLLMFLTPMSIQLRFIISDPPFDIFLPTELMLFLILIITIFKAVKERAFRGRLIKHPVSIMVLTMLVWMLITSLTGSLLFVSIKYLLARTWFIAGYYFIGVMLVSDRNMIRRSVTALFAGMIPVIIFDLVRLQGGGLFNQQLAHVTAWPFFNDHTSFGATVAFLLPWTLWLPVKVGQGRKRKISKPVSLLLFFVFLAALIFSYSRAAWFSAIVMTLFATILLLRIPLKGVIVAVAGLALIVYGFREPLMSRLESNRQDSSGNITEHVISMANITTDASNLERINRWKSAIRMIGERPLLGWGPGTYQFMYAPYQNSAERTIISTNFGDRGNAHSEYLGAAVDSGIPGGLIFITLAIWAVYLGYRVWKTSDVKWERLTALTAITGLMGYLSHAFLNNFLDTDKISAPYWFSIAIIVMLDLGKRKRKAEVSQEQQQ